jgi:hypothetical protein
MKSRIWWFMLSTHNIWKTGMKQYFMYFSCQSLYLQCSVPIYHLFLGMRQARPARRWNRNVCLALRQTYTQKFSILKNISAAILLAQTLLLNSFQITATTFEWVLVQRHISHGTRTRKFSVCPTRKSTWRTSEKPVNFYQTTLATSHSSQWESETSPRTSLKFQTERWKDYD